MPDWAWPAVVALALYAAFVLALVLAGRRGAAWALAGFVPDCIVLCHRLLRDDRVPRKRKLALVALVAYLAMPIDLVPDVIPVAGQLDDAILMALVLRGVLRAAGTAAIAEHWPGPAASLRVLVAISDSERARRSWPGRRVG